MTWDTKKVKAWRQYRSQEIKRAAVQLMFRLKQKSKIRVLKGDKQ